MLNYDSILELTRNLKESSNAENPWDDIHDYLNDYLERQNAPQFPKGEQGIVPKQRSLQTPTFLEVSMTNCLFEVRLF